MSECWELRLRRFPVGVWAVIFSVSFMFGCKDSVESHYESVAVAAHAGMFDHGWIPQILKPDVRDMVVWYDVSSNEVRGKFALNPGVTERIQSLCKPASNRPRRTWWMPGWFPAPINQGGASEHGLQMFRCEDYFVATEPATGNGYFWEMEIQYPRSKR
jgi:hypothetical protein